MGVHLRVHTEANGMLPGLYPEPFQFPGGEWDLRNIPPIPTDQGRVTLIADVRGADVNDLVKAGLWKDVAARGNWGPMRQDADFVLMLPYVPAARADRGIPMGISVYARIIRSLNADRIIVLDPHSKQTEHSYSLASLKIVNHIPLLAEALETAKLHYDGVIIPDKGARERSTEAAQWLGLPTYQAGKVRDFETGDLSGFEMEDTLPAQGNFLIVDDICDGGGTFIGLADHLYRDHGVSKDRLGLWVTHGVFSGHANELREFYTDIMTTDSHPGSNRIGVATTIVPCFLPMYKAMIRR